MDLQEFNESFRSLSPLSKIKFIYTHIESLREEERTQVMLAILRDVTSSPLVRATALKFLRKYCFEDTTIFKDFLKDKHPAVVKASARALKESEAKDQKFHSIVQSILKKLEATKDKQKRLKILKAISKLKAAWVTLVLLEVLSDPSEKIRDFIIKELSQKESLDQNLIDQKLIRNPWFVKSAVLKIFGLRKDPRAIKSIERVISDPSVEVRRTAAQALGEIGGKEAICLLVKLSEDENHYVKVSAEEALHKTSEIRFS
jgi:HEAT repeat protein